MRWIGLGVVALTGCANSSGYTVAPASDVGATLVAPSSSVSVTPSSLPPTHQLPDISFERLEPPPSPEPTPHIEILFPYAGRTISLPQREEYKVRLRVEHWNGRVQLALDHYRPILLDDAAAPVPLRALVPLDRDLEVGHHRLFAVAIDSRGRAIRPRGRESRGPFSVVEFRVGERGPLEGDHPFLAYSQPRGTYNGDSAADGIFVDFYLVGAELSANGSRARVTVTGGGGKWVEQLEVWQPLAIRGMPSGDFDVRIELLDEDGALDPQVLAVERTITINRDAPLPVESAASGG